MGWVRVDDHFDEHPKLAKVGPVGWGIWLAGLAYCNRNLTDGFIPRSVARSLGDFEVERDGEFFQFGVFSGMSGADLETCWVVQLLVEAELWDEVRGGYHIHDYSDYQPSREKVLAERAAKAARQARWRSSNASTDTSTNASVDDTVDTPEGASVTPLVWPDPNPNPRTA